jgi:c-di-GMP-binding flagellar brake protein YcgR
MERKRVDTERRKFRRVKIAFDVECSVEGAEPLKKRSLAKNVGIGGLCIIAYKKLEIGSILSLKIYLPDGEEPFGAKGRLVWEREFTSQDSIVRYDVGIEFLNMEKQNLQRLSRYISQLPD